MAEISIDEFKPNSNKYKQEQEAKKAESVDISTKKKVSKVVQGEAKKQKRSFGKILFNTFIDENVEDVKGYLIYDVLVPAIKENIADLINSAVSMLFFGETYRRVSRRNGNGNSNGGSKINYNGYFNNGQRPERIANSTRFRSSHNFEDVQFDSKGEAELVLDNMLEILSSYKVVTVMDFYDLSGVSTEFTDNKYGWTDLRGARVIGSPSRGYVIDLPRCIALDT